MDLISILLSSFGVVAVALAAWFTAKRSGAKDVIDILTHKVDLLEESLAKREIEVNELRRKVAYLTEMVRGDEALQRIEAKLDDIDRLVRQGVHTPSHRP